MSLAAFKNFDARRVPSPCFVVDEHAIENNLAILKDVADRSGAKILAALKAFSCWHLAELTSRYLSGTCASGVHEARLGAEKYGGEVHVFSAAYKQDDLAAILPLAHHVVFNSFSQWQRFKAQALRAQQQRPDLRFGLRINPEHSEGAVPIYDPCAPGSRLGIVHKAFAGQSLDGISGLHMHTLCEQGFDPLARTLDVVEAKFGAMLHQLEWLNLGGGHHITQPDYDREALIKRLQDLSQKYAIQVYLEPGEAIAINSGILVAEVLDISWNQLPQAILDTSATCHMPDVLEMPYRPSIDSAGEVGEYPHTYRLGGMTCLAGDVVGDYSFANELQVGDRLKFMDMSHYTMVKTTTFNGIALPAIAIWNSASDSLEVIKEFGYKDFAERLS